MTDIQTMLDSFNSPPTRHAMLVHLPIALTMVGALLTLLAAVWRRNTTLRGLALACQAGLAVAVFAAVKSGESAESAITAVVTPEVYEVVSEHEDMAGRMWLFAVGALLFLALSVVIKGAIATLTAWLAVAVAISAVAWIGATAHHGGELVYRYGVGTPQPVACHDLPGVRSDGRDHAAERAAAQASISSDTQDALTTADQASAEQTAFFLDQAYPILAEHCFNCHNAARVARDKSGLLDQTSLATMLKGGRHGPAIVIGKPEESLLMKRMRGDDPDEEIMPPDGRLTEEQIALIAQWIRDGAIWADPASN